MPRRDRYVLHPRVWTKMSRSETVPHIGPYMFLVYGGEDELVVKGYTDASFQTDMDDFRSQYGYVFIMNGGAMSWKSSKQEMLADSTTEAEYLAASEASKEGVWIRDFISLLGVVPDSANPLDLYCDNSG